MNSSEKTNPEMVGFNSCGKDHVTIYYSYDIHCPLCKETQLKKFYLSRSVDLKNKYEMLHNNALKFSPEILL